jgi:geranylgeranyl diphosphate synthase type I
MSITRERFIQELQQRDVWVVEVLNRPEYRDSFAPDVLREAVYSYLNRPAKRLRPGILFFCCGAAGGREELARQAAASVEVYHTWTLVHDDIIDNDPKRRGRPTVHEAYRLKALEWGYAPEAAAQLGESVAILTGDLQHAWAIRLLLDSAKQGVALPIIFDLINRLEADVTNGLVEGEALDVLFSRRPIPELAEADILRMLELKTGVLYEYAGIAGASIGFGQTALENPLIGAIGRFARRCGTAFQLQDDILGIIGDEARIGKEVGSDIREGKRTTIVLHAYQNAGADDRSYLEQWLGNPAASLREIERIKELLIEYQGIEATRQLAMEIVTAALAEITSLPESPYKELLTHWAGFVVDREL